MTTDAASKEKQGQKMVPLAELVAQRQKSRQRETELKSQLQERDTRISGLEDELKVVGVDVEDDEKLKNVRAYLVDREKKLAKEKADHDKKVTSLEAREREATVKELAAEFRAKGVEVDAETLMDEDDPRLKCMELYAAHLEQKTAQEEKEETPQVFETGPQGVTKKMPADMTDEEFAEHEKTLKAEHYSKR